MKRKLSKLTEQQPADAGVDKDKQPADATAVDDGAATEQVRWL
jgi:hypothetical protein